MSQSVINEILQRCRKRGKREKWEKNENENLIIASRMLASQQLCKEMIIL